MYYPGEDPCNHREENSRRGFHVRPYLKKLKKINSYEHFWVYKSYGQLQYYHPDEINWQPDKDQTLEKLFFNYHYPCSSFVVLDKKEITSAIMASLDPTKFLSSVKNLQKRGYLLTLNKKRIPSENF